MNNNKIVPELRFPEFRNEGEWEEKKLGEILDNESSNISLNKLELAPTGYPVYGADGLVGYVDNYKQNEDYIAIIKDGSGVGRLYYYQGKSSILGTLTYLKPVDLDMCNLLFQYYLLNTIDFSSYIKGSGIPHIYYSDYRDEKTTIPKPHEQQKIADCLSSLDEVIEGYEERLLALQDHKRGLMQNLFPQEGKTKPKYRFPEFKNNGEWEEKKLGEIGDPLMCKRIFKEETTDKKDGNIPFYKIGTFGGIADSYITKQLFEEYKEKYSYPHKGEILISASGTIGRLVIFDGEPSFFQDSNIVWIRINDIYIINSFLYYSYLTLTWQTSDGGVIRRLYNSDLKNMNVVFPQNRDEQQKIADCLSSLDDMITGQTERIEQLRQHKRGLMQGLFPKIEE